MTPARRPWGPVYGRCTTWKGCHQVVEEGWSTETRIVFLAAGIIRVLDSIAWVPCAYDNVFSHYCWKLVQRSAATEEVAFRGWQGGLWWPLLLFAKGSVKSPPLADFWIIAFEHFHYVTAFVIFAKYFLFLQNVDILVEGFPVMTQRHCYKTTRPRGV